MAPGPPGGPPSRGLQRPPGAPGAFGASGTSAEACCKGVKGVLKGSERPEPGCLGEFHADRLRVDHTCLCICICSR